MVLHRVLLIKIYWKLKRYYRSRTSLCRLALALCLMIGVLSVYRWYCPPVDYYHTLEWARRYDEQRQEKFLMADKGGGCEMPALDPFAKEMMQFEEKLLPKLQCKGMDWVKCYQSECRVVKQILKTAVDVECTYRDILYESDRRYSIGAATVLRGDKVYTLERSDHVKVSCTGRLRNHSVISSQWSGYAAGLRQSVRPVRPPRGREKTSNVLMLAFDSTSRNGFIRRMPRSYSVLQDELRATILESYNVLGDGTTASLFPILTGKTEAELPECRKSMPGSGYVDSMPFIFYKLKDDGYRTAYFEDAPGIGTFQYRFNGFLKQPADHYLRAFFREEFKSGREDWTSIQRFCLGDTPQFKIMLNLTSQFFKLDGKRFAFTFISDITHDDFNKISIADEDLAEFLLEFKRQGHVKDTMLIVMGDHGPRFFHVRKTTQGRLEERLPLMAIVLPENLKVHRPEAQLNLDSNLLVLTTPHDVHATLLDVMDMRQHWNTYTLKGTHLTRGMTLLQAIPRSRSCGEATVEPHWCACSKWSDVSNNEPMYHRTARALLDYINQLTQFVRSKCVPRTLTSVGWVTRKQLSHTNINTNNNNSDGPGDDGDAKPGNVFYQMQITVGPGEGKYEAVVIHHGDTDQLEVMATQISRINAYKLEPACITNKYPHLNKYCYCNQ